MKFWKGILLSSAIVFSGVVIWWLRTPVPEMVRAANQSAYAFSVSWIYPRPAGGCVAAYAGIKNMAVKCSKDRSRLHLIEVSGLNPETGYSVFIWNGLKVIRVQTPFYRQVSTLSVRDALPKLPQPGYGSVVDASGRPISGALVFVYRHVSDRFYFPAAAVTNESGNYSVDLSNLEQMNQPFTVGSYLIEAVDRTGKTTKQIFDREFHSPFPPIKIE